MAERKRLDIVLVERGLAPTRAKARGMIMAAEVMVDGQVTSKPGMPVSSEAKVELKQKPRFVSRGGEKLAGALTDFQLRVEDRICADVGASTGGFTDCLLQNGAARVYAIDVGYGQLDYGLRQDDRVVVMERTNARHVEQLSEKVDLVVIDASFISLRLLLPVVKNWLDNEADIITLIKPQFEAGKKDVGKGGVVRDPDIHRRVLSEILTFATEQSFAVHGLTRSPITGPAGNIEFLAWLGWASESAAPPIEIADLIEAVI